MLSLYTFTGAHEYRESTSHMTMFYVLVITDISYLEFRGIITIVSNKEKTCHVCVIDFPQCNCPKFTMISSQYYRRGSNECHAYMCIMSSNIYAGLTMPLTSSFMSQPSATKGNVSSQGCQCGSKILFWYNDLTYCHCQRIVGY